MTARLLLILVALAIPLAAHFEAFAQTPEGWLKNGQLELWSNSSVPDGWFSPRVTRERGYIVSEANDDVFEGESAALVDATMADPASQSFGNLSQVVDAVPLRGKRVRFRGAVKVDDASKENRAQLWFRVDRVPTAGQRIAMGAFDNMGDRPIRGSEWKHYDIVATVDEDAQSLIVGMLVFGNAKAWLDDVSLTEVSETTAETARKVDRRTGEMRTAEDEPQPFFVAWLWLVVITLGLFALSQTKFRRQSLRGVSRFAFRFSFAYWLLYCLPKPIGVFVPYVGYKITSAYNNIVKWIVDWTAPNVLGFEMKPLGPTGSGDTTYDYVQLLVCFALAVLVAVIWSLVDRRKSDYAWANDLLRSFIRYVLAFTMLGYGLAKVGFELNQFSPPGIDRLMHSYGDSSPMGLLWTFMGASRAYTFFAGLGEVVGALLLIWRRTTTLGALVVVGVMTNVVALNFCYDVPVKQYSSHLLCMAVFLLLPEVGRLGNVLIWNRATEPKALAVPYVGSKTVWVQRAIKAWLIVWGIGIPMWQKANREWKYEPDQSGAPAVFGVYEVELFREDGPGQQDRLVSSARTEWRTVTLRRSPYGLGGKRERTDYLAVTRLDGTRSMLTVDYSPREQTLTVRGAGDGPSAMKMEPIDGDRIRLIADVGERKWRMLLRRIKREEFLLVNRGFHWINEYPHNR